MVRDERAVRLFAEYLYRLFAPNRLPIGCPE